MRELFVANYDVLTADMLQDLFTVEYSLRGSNERDREEETILHWITLLQEIEGMIFSHGFSYCALKIVSMKI